MARYTGQDHRDARVKRGTLVKGNLCPGMWVEDPQVTLARNVETLLKKWRKDGRTLIQFSKDSGIPTTTVRYLRLGMSWPEPGTLRKLASTLGVPIEVLFRR